MASEPPASPTPEGPRKATLRARTPTNRVRSEVIDALDDLERSLGDVARWEQLLTGKEAGPEWQRPDDPPPRTRPRHLGPGHLAAADDDLEIDEVVADLHEAIRELDDRIDEIRPDVRSITFQEPDAVDASLEAATELGQVPADVEPDIEPIEVAPLLLQARTIEPERPRRSVTPEELDEVEKRRRNGRMLTATGLALLAGLGALFLLPDDKGDGETPLEQDTVPTVTVTVPTTELLPELPAIPSEETTTLPTAPPETTATTKKATTATTKAPAPTTTTTQPKTTTSLGQPGPPPTDPITPTTAATTTSTVGPGEL